MFDCHLVEHYSQKKRQKNGSKFGIPVSVIHESGDSSNKEAPPSNPNRKELMRKEWSMVVSMLVAMKADDGLRRGAIMFITKTFGMACCTVYCLWERAKSVCELGIINSPEFISCKKLQKKGYVSN